MDKILEAHHINKAYGTRNSQINVLNNISFEVEQGEFIGIMGPSGAGKSTLLKVLSTIEWPNMGTVMIDGENILKLRDSQISELRQNKIGFIFQNFNVMNTLTVRDNILLPLAIRHTNLEEMSARLTNVAKRLGIEAILDAYPKAISIGQRQRVAAARALIKKPKVIFADEPTGALDSKSSAELLTYLTEMNQQDKVTIVMVTHDPYTASYCHRILFIKDGAIFSEVVRKDSRKKFFQRVIDMQAAIGGGGLVNDF